MPPKTRTQMMRGTPVPSLPKRTESIAETMEPNAASKLAMATWIQFSIPGESCAQDGTAPPSIVAATKESGKMRATKSS